MNNLRPNKERATRATVLIVIVMSIEVLSLVFDYFQYDLLQKIKAGIHVSKASAEANDSVVSFLAILTIGVLIVSAFTFILWFRRAYYNLGVVRHDLNHTDGWAAGCWFVPIVSLYMPYQMMKELYEKTDSYLINNNVANYQKRISTSLLGIWWTFWIIGSVVGNINSRLALKANTLFEYETTTVLSIICTLITLIAGVLIIQIINKYAKIEHLLAEPKREIDNVDNK